MISVRRTLSRAFSTVSFEIQAGRSLLTVGPDSAVNEKSGTVVIQSKVATVTPLDAALLAGGLGSSRGVAGVSSVGVVTQRAKNVTTVNVNDNVLVSNREGGAWSATAVLPSHAVFKLPPGISAEKAAFLPFAVEAHAIFSQANLAAGSLVAVNGAASPFGLAAIQLAKARGHKVIALLGSSEEVASLSKIGADLVVTVAEAGSAAFLKNVTTMGRVHLSIDSVGGKASVALARMLGKNGSMVVIGSGNFFEPLQFSARSFIFEDIHVRGFNASSWSATNPTAYAAAINDVVSLMSTNKLSTPPHESFPVSEAAKAVEASNKGSKFVVIKF